MDVVSSFELLEQKDATLGISIGSGGVGSDLWNMYKQS